ncbi:phenylalanine-4-hydroxylase [Streptomyces aurantiacus]|uniref:phenylalanine 4-monooxygenase n=1 Tax=Streptomyces aurantiacus TaxID=47760 RepID=UPI00279107D3|nr:phenylalanine 4-monooxygenase [Streptomyces aurantiacus]MDQ0771841.1 phenylalanine-4-hydroxylase [Streptomyces aurantiacus]
MEENSGYPDIRNVGGTVVVDFPPSHPGHHDVAYHRRRVAIAEAAFRAGPPSSAPDIAYTDEEQRVWRTVSAALTGPHVKHACREFLEGSDRLDLPADRLPQLGEVSDRIERLTGARFSSAPGMLAPRDFYSSLAERRFQATQYIRHPSRPHFSPEPDMIHEIIGHGTALANNRWADLYEMFGHTVRRLAGREAVSAVSNVFWFTMEAGLVKEDGDIKACGATLLSSCGELENIARADIRPLDTTAVQQQPYVVTGYQPVLFCAESFDHLEDVLRDYLTGIQDKE